MYRYFGSDDFSADSLLFRDRTWNKERMLSTVNEALDDKTLKIASVLSEAAALEKRYSTNETLYQCLDKKYTKDLDYLIQYQETFQVLFQKQICILIILEWLDCIQTIRH